MTPIQKLDIVLNYLADQFPLYAQYKDGDIFSALIKLKPELLEGLKRMIIQLIKTLRVR